MITSEELVRDFERNRRIVQAQCEGLSHEDALIQPPFGANCLNWTVGHLVVHRDKVLHALGQEGVLDEPTFARYTNESEPVTGDGPDIRPLADLLTALDESQERIAAAVPATDFAAPFDHDRFKTVGARVRFYYFHDTYHTGQTEILRSLAGKDDKLI